MDLIITYGPESAERISKKGINAVPVGNLLFNDWFRDEISEENVNIIKRRLLPEKQTILYMPTWGSDSSIDTFSEEIFSLVDEYNVIVKLHHSTFTGEANRLCKCLSFPEIIVPGDYYDPLPLYKVSDIVITDGVSGAAFDALLLDKPILTIGSSMENYGIEMNPGLSKILKSIPFIDGPTKLRESLEKIDKQSFILDQDIKYSLFFHQDGKAGERAAETIMDDKKYPHIPTVEKYDRALERASDPKQRKFIQNRKNDFLQRYYPDRIRDPSFVSRVYRRFFKNN